MSCCANKLKYFIYEVFMLAPSQTVMLIKFLHEITPVFFIPTLQTNIKCPHDTIFIEVFYLNHT